MASTSVCESKGFKIKIETEKPRSGNPNSLKKLCHGSPDHFV